MSRVNGIAFGLALSIALGAVGCGSAEPRYGEASVSSGAPRITLTGTTFGEAAAMELAPGCPGYLDATVPGHVVHVQEALPFRVRATSNDAPLALAVAKGDEVRCDSDEGSGHAPSIALEGPGDYQIFVAALRSPAELAYEITIEASVPAQPGEPVAENGPREVSVTITSEPTGAEVRDSSGSVIGTTPAMFVLNVEPDQVGQERTFTLAMDGHSETQVTGALNGGALVLHGQLPVLGPTVIDEHSTESQPIRDYQTATMAIDVDESCSITDAEVGVNIHHSFVGDLRVVLQTPWNDEIMLQRHAGGGRRNLQRTWRTSERGSQLTDLIG
ncbi:MAG: proprotein convertase P-domain-containing protein, partial [Sandaracinaceae bacterium]